MSNVNKRASIIFVAIIIILTLVIVLLLSQNAALEKSRQDLSESNRALLNSNNELSVKLENATFNFQDLQENYTKLLNFFGQDTDPKVQTRLGATIIERYDTKEDYLWVTGEVENQENTVIYGVKLNFTLYTNDGTDSSQLIIGTMQPHQVVNIRTEVTTQLGDIINWTIEPIATFLPID